MVITIPSVLVGVGIACLLLAAFGGKVGSLQPFPLGVALLAIAYFVTITGL